ncbi:AAA family ATPase [Clostridium botulinum]|uniref:UvrD-helicase domain-containing protein n=2 Tax=Clostridium botulinum TaxID=1491 RepID=UPI0013F04B0C|nr:UvrD-helicase domain-containing protein [Clostridium botulinum]MBY6753755.1 UvrD-helicase domain-containing protein [Clostridium botulinum]MBY6763301.1 UvrD-helicase domain-containing protein [Clostridium botulinum]MBY6989891.1 UvrD-helicase domain-containing protein [Clostridium botulinum]MBY7017023.1 UvrD-helicase domain-containing protein [Clostridium botulinum]MBY7033837.1 UvrD-helicase domain-containing protein [Clostridium botulinum]
MHLDVISGLNDAQREAVTTTEGYIRVIAGAGSGKTKALTSRYIYLVHELGISTANILCATFTNKAAREMKKRIRTMIGDNDTGLIGTFHGFCRRLLKEDIYTINYPDNFIVMDNEDMDLVLRIVYEDANISSKQFTFSKAKDMISKRKNKDFKYISYIIETDNNELKKKFLTSKNVEDRIFYGYLYQQKKNYNLDFNDLIIFTLHILETFPKVRKKWQQKLEYIMVDEFQDVNIKQYRLVSILSEYHKNLFVVGDPDQTVYSWRGANINLILNFDKEFKGTKTIMMNQNYRSSSNIIKASNSLISKNKQRIDKELIPIKHGNIPVVYKHSENIYKEANWIINQIEQIIKGGNSYKNIAILYRAHYVSRSIEEALLKNKIPYTLYSGVEFYQRKEIKDILSYLRMVVFEDDLSFIRIINEPKRNFGKKRMEIIRKYAEDNNCSLYSSLKINLEDKLIAKSKADKFVDLIERYKKIYKEMRITDLLMELLNNSGYEAMLRESGEDERLENLAELKNSISDYENSAGEDTTLEDYLQEISLFTNSDLKENKDTINMMTLHTAKGLEFPYVFICEFNEGIFPSARTNTKEKMEEERRLAYVGYTRAKNALFLSDAEGVNYDGSYRFPSRFIFNTGKTYLNYLVELKESLIDDANEFISDSENSMNKSNNIKFKIGERIIHKLLGLGVIIGIDNDNSSYMIKFDNAETFRNISFSTQLDKADTNNLDIIKSNERKAIDHLEAERLEAERKEQERLEAERLEAERKEQERLEAERLEAERKEQERLEAERLEAERKEQERLEAEQIEVSTMILKIKEEISELEEIVSKNKYKLFGKGAILKKEAKKRIQILYLKIDEISN